MNLLLPLLQLLSLLFLIGVGNTRSTYDEEEIQQFLTENQFSKFLGLEGDPEYEIITPVRRDHLGNKLTRNVKENYPEEKFYTLEGLGHKFELHLKKNLNSVDNDLLFTTRNEDGTITNHRLSRSNEDLYQGTSTSHLGSLVAMSTSGGLTGLIRTKNGDFIVEKLPENLRKRDANPDEEHDHIIYKKTSTGKMKCGTHKRNKDYSNWKESIPDLQQRATSASELFVETAVFADRQLYLIFKNRYGDTEALKELLNCIKAVINAIEILYKNPDLLKIPIKFILIKVEIFLNDKPGFEITDDADKYLNNFCKWQGEMNNQDDTANEHWDHAFMFTGRNLGTEGSGGVLGIAPLEGMCDNEISCTLTEMKNFVGVYTGAHEAGHNFGMEHDGDGNECDSHKYIMAPVDEAGQDTWSTCSKSYIDTYIKKGYANCLSDSRTQDIISHDGPLPGQLYTLDQQCKFLVNSTEATHEKHQIISEICYSIKCFDGKRFEYRGHPALEGTDCGNDKWCRSGKCIPKDNMHQKEDSSNHDEDVTESIPVDGGWSIWTTAEACHSNCMLNGTGLQILKRECNNPSPQNGGKLCVGRKTKIVRCTDKKICDDWIIPKTYATEICKSNGKGQGLKYEHEKYGCSIFCETKPNEFHNIPRYFPDGTLCKRGKNLYCISGKCKTL